MAISIGSFPGISASTAPPSGGGAIDAQLATCQAQLGDWLTCSSSKTSEGKAKIAELSSKLSNLKQQKQLEEALKQSQAQAANSRPATSSIANHASASDLSTAARSTSSVGLIGGIGRLVDAYA